MTFYELIHEAENRPLLFEDVTAFLEECSSESWLAGLDCCALELAKTYAAGEVSFDAADNLANILFAFAAQRHSIPDLMMSIFLAFDAGEFYPNEIRSPSSEERFTRPQINEILRKHVNV